MSRHTRRLLDLAAAAPASTNEDLLPLLREASDLYHQGFENLHASITTQVADLSINDLSAAVNAAGLPHAATQDRDQLVLALTLGQWEQTPAAMAYSEMAEAAAHRGVCLIPED